MLSTSNRYAGYSIVARSIASSIPPGAFGETDDVPLVRTKLPFLLSDSLSILGR